MSWFVERDEEGLPLRMFWTGNARVSELAIGEELMQPEPLHFMPAMREWAIAHGLDPRTGLPDPEPCA